MKKKIIKVKPKVKKKQEYNKSVPTFMKNFKPPLVVVKNEYGELELVNSETEDNFICPNYNSRKVFCSIPGLHIYYYKCGNCKKNR